MATKPVFLPCLPRNSSKLFASFEYPSYWSNHWANSTEVLKLRLLHYKSWRDKYFPYNPIEEVLVLKASFRFRYHFLLSKICKNNYLWGYKDIFTKSLPTHHVSGIQSSTVNICTLIRHVCLRSLEVDWQATKLRWFLYDSVSANVFIIFSVVILNII